MRGGPMKFRKKPVVIDAVRWTGDMVPVTVLVGHDLQPFGDGALCIHTLEGDHRCDLGDWIIKGVKGELYPCKPDIFAMTYEPAEPTAPGEGRRSRGTSREERIRLDRLLRELGADGMITSVAHTLVKLRRAVDLLDRVNPHLHKCPLYATVNGPCTCDVWEIMSALEE